jgi:hypothetical protein
MKTSSTFKMEKESKRVAATFTDKEIRRFYLDRAIEAQLGEEAAKRSALKVRDKE